MHRIRLFLALGLLMLSLALIPAVAYAQDEPSDGDNQIADVDDQLENNINYENWELIVAFVTPLIVSVLVQSGWNQRTQAIVAFVAALVITFIGTWLQGDLEVDDWLGSTLKVFPVAIAFYYGLWKPTGIAGGIQTKTDLGSSSP
jgi:TRAP-type C4-dicarboxylate transport system permease large subunit